jgi:hypothetical protein
VDFTVVRVALHRGACSRGYKLLREGAGPKSLEWWWWLLFFFSWFFDCLFLILFALDPAFPFIASKGRARVTFAI